MILNEVLKDVEIKGDLEKIQFRMDVGPHSFRVIFDSLYKDKIGAVIRELGTNAVDSHIMAGKPDEPIIIHIPNHFEPYFSVKDNGVGLSPDQISNIYTVAFASDKRTSNDMTGCWGLGSKTPFAIASRFTVESRYNGRKYLYCGYKDENGMPTISKMSESDTDECNGVEVKIDVDKYKSDEFKRKLQQIFRWFKVKPVVVGAEVEFPPFDYAIEGDYYALLSHNNEYINGSNSQVVMGNVAYPIEYTQLYGYGEAEYKFLSHGLHLFVPIGTVSITPSRESLEYVPKTIEVLKKLVGEAYKECRAKYAEGYETVDDVWEVRKAVYSLCKTPVGNALNLDKITWRGQTIDYRVPITGTKDVRYYTYSTSGKKVKMNMAFSIDATPHTKYLINDLGTLNPARQRISRWMRDNNIKEVYEFIEIEQDFLDKSGVGNHTTNVSDLPRATVNRVNNSSLVKINEFVQPASGVAKDYWQPTDLTEEDEGIYVIIRNYKCLSLQHKLPDDVDGLEFLDPGVLSSILGDLVNAGHPVKKLYGARPRDSKSLRGTDWMYLRSYINKILDKNKEQLVHRLNFSRSEWDIKPIVKAFSHLEVPAGPLKDLVDWCVKTKELGDKVELYYLTNLARYVAYSVGEDNDKLEVLAKAVQDRYPLYNAVKQSLGYDLYITEFLKYVRAVDAERSTKLVALPWVDGCAVTQETEELAYA